jgi:sugar phosphate permease
VGGSIVGRYQNKTNFDEWQDIFFIVAGYMLILSILILVFLKPHPK